MSTRGAIGFRLNGQDLVTYNHSDSYPEWLGLRMGEYLQAHSQDQMREVAARIRLVPHDYEPTSADIESHLDSLNLDVSEKSPEDIYSLLRDSQGDLAYYDEPRHYLMKDDAGFMEDSLFCEWAYVIDLDEAVLEVYRGFNKDPEAPGRYATLGDGDYQGVALVATYPLATLPEPEALVADIMAKTGEEEE